MLRTLMMPVALLLSLVSAQQTLCLQPKYSHMQGSRLCESGDAVVTPWVKEQEMSYLKTVLFVLMPSYILCNYTYFYAVHPIKMYKNTT